MAGAAGELLLHVFDDSWGEPYSALPAYWETESGESYFLDLLSTNDGYTGHVPLGRGKFVPLAEWRVLETDPIEIHAGKNVVALHVHFPPGVAIALECEGRCVPWQDEVGCSIVPVGHDGECTAVDRALVATTFIFSKPGRYRVQLPTIVGFEPVPPIEIDVPEGKPLFRKIELKHKP